MDIRFEPHNTHLAGRSTFLKQDPHLRRLAAQPLPYRSPLIDSLPARSPGIYSITGGRQIGKTTLLKQWMGELLEKRKPEDLYFLTGELIDDHHQLVRLVQEAKAKIIIVDEVTYIRDWDKAIKFLADAGSLEQKIVILTGSDSSVIHEARSRFPGRRGKADQVDFHLHPLTFYEVVNLKRPKGKSDTRELFKEFQNYLIHGGFLTAINEHYATKEISQATLRTYSDWIRGDLMKRGKNEAFLRDIFEALVKCQSSQVTWNGLAKGLTIDHPATVFDYIHLLSLFDIVTIQSALLEHKLKAAPKKAKKIVFNDPFIFHAVRHWLSPDPHPYENQILPICGSAESASLLVEGVAVSHMSRWYPTFYLKGDGEVDIAYVKDGKFWPIEIKWTERLRAQDLKQILKYPQGRIWTKTSEISQFHSLPVEPLPRALFEFGQEAD